MKVEILNKGGKPIVRVTLNNGTRPDETPCDNEEQARIYARGLVDGARALANEIQQPAGFHYAPEDEE
jgi:hypothetical protein